MEKVFPWLVVGITVFADFILIAFWRRKNTPFYSRQPEENLLRIFGQVSPVLTLLKKACQPVIYYGKHPVRLFKSLYQKTIVLLKRLSAALITLDTRINSGISFLRNNLGVAKIKIRAKTGLALEILVILIFTLLIGKNYLDMDPLKVPHGGDLPLQVYNHIIWTWWGDCGSCIFWNSSLNGGDPSFSNIQDSALHPLTILVTLFAGVVNGSKILILSSLFVGALAQWWLALEFELGRIARLWAAFAVILGPQYNQRLEMGLLGVIIATSSAALTLPVLVHLIKRGPSRKFAGILGLLLALLILAGQGYIQISYVLGFLPVFLIVCIKSFSPSVFKPVFKSLVQSVISAVLLASILLVPTIRVMQYFDKDGNLGLDYGFTLSETFQNTINENDDNRLNFMYIGWTVVGLALLGLLLSKPADRSLLGVFTVAAVWIMVLSSEEFLQLAFKFVPQVEKIRFPSLMTGLCIPFILSVSAYGLDRLIEFTRIAFIQMSAEWNGLVLLLRLGVFAVVALSLINLNRVNNQWFYVEDRSNDIQEFTLEEQALHTNSLQWVEGYLGVFPSNLYLQLKDYKLTNVYRPFYLKEHVHPEPMIRITYDSVDPQSTQGQIVQLDSIHTIVTNIQNQYASVQTETGVVQPCKASGKGGKISVTCDYSKDGTLIVMENFVPGWKVSIDGTSAALLEDEYLSVPAQAGLHTYEFVYDPWDVKVGIFLSIIGLVMTARLIFKPEPVGQLE